MSRKNKQETELQFYNPKTGQVETRVIRGKRQTVDTSILPIDVRVTRNNKLAWKIARRLGLIRDL